MLINDVWHIVRDFRVGLNAFSLFSELALRDHGLWTVQVEVGGLPD